MTKILLIGALLLCIASASYSYGLHQGGKQCDNHKYERGYSDGATYVFSAIRNGLVYKGPPQMAPGSTISNAIFFSEPFTDTIEYRKPMRGAITGFTNACLIHSCKLLYTE